MVCMDRSYLFHLCACVCVCVCVCVYMHVYTNKEGDLISTPLSPRCLNRQQQLRVVNHYGKVVGILTSGNLFARAHEHTACTFVNTHTHEHARALCV